MIDSAVVVYASLSGNFLLWRIQSGAFEPEKFQKENLESDLRCASQADLLLFLDLNSRCVLTRSIAASSVLQDGPDYL